MIKSDLLTFSRNGCETPGYEADCGPIQCAEAAEANALLPSALAGTLEKVGRRIESRCKELVTIVILIMIMVMPDIVNTKIYQMNDL